MTIIIFGSEGFIGSHCNRYFTEQGHEVYCADIVVKQAERYLLVSPDGSNYGTIFSSQGFDLCINASGAANVQFSFSQPYADFYLNTVNVYAILDAIRIHNPACHFINLSSAAVYGNPELLPIREDANVQHPTSPYGWHKLYSEQICKEFYNFFGVRTLNLRIFSAYGAGLRKQLFWDLYQKAKKASNLLSVYGTGNETRDFIYIEDLMAAIHHIVKAGKYEGGCINIASGHATTIFEAVKIFMQQYDPSIEVKFTGEAKEGDPLYWQADIELLKGLGFVSQYSLQEGLTETVNWLKRQD